MFFKRKKYRLEIDFNAKVHNRIMYGYSVRDVKSDCCFYVIVMTITIAGMLGIAKEDERSAFFSINKLLGVQEEQLSPAEILANEKRLAVQLEIQEYMVVAHQVEESISNEYMQFGIYEMDLREDSYKKIEKNLLLNEQKLMTDNESVTAIKEYLITQNDIVKKLLKVTWIAQQSNSSLSVKDELIAVFEANQKKRKTLFAEVLLENQTNREDVKYGKIAYFKP